jgi:hypothetical protein
MHKPLSTLSAMLAEARILQQEARDLRAQSLAALQLGDLDRFTTLGHRSHQLQTEASTLVAQVTAQRYQDELPLGTPQRSGPPT